MTDSVTEARKQPMLACPFCGGRGVVVAFGVKPIAYVRCESCGAQGREFDQLRYPDFAGDAVRAWNKRR